MAWYGDIEALRARAGLEPADATKDAELVAAAETVLSVVEEYLDRGLEFQDEIEDFYDWYGYSLLVHRWPIFPGSLNAISLDEAMVATPQNVALNRIDYQKGIVYYSALARPLRVTYTGGYEVFPLALKWAMFAVFDIYWSTTPGWGGSSGGGGSSIVQGTGELKSVAIPGVATLTYDVGATSTGGGGSSSSGFVSDPWANLPVEIMSILDRYRRESAIGVG